MPQPQQCQIWAVSVTCTTAHSNSRLPTHWARPGIEPTSSWILVRFVTTERHGNSCSVIFLLVHTGLRVNKSWWFGRGFFFFFVLFCFYWWHVSSLQKKIKVIFWTKTMKKQPFFFSLSCIRGRKTAGGALLSNLLANKTGAYILIG